jgi:hypothetical protein
MFRRFAFAAFAAVAVMQTGCHGRVASFFYRLTHCDGCCPSYGYAPAYAAPSYPSYGAPGCATCYNGATPAATPVYSGQPVFGTITPQPMAQPGVYPNGGSVPPAAGGTTDKK